jgi:hypothetical protein
MLTIARGQPIEVVTSSSEGRRHPVAGDKGFISNAYLLPNQQLILCDIYFFRFGNETRTRCERKLFAIDLGIDNNIKKLLIKGQKRQHISYLFLPAVNLTPTFYYLREQEMAMQDLPRMFSNTGLFRGQIRRSMSQTMKAEIKIPFGDVKSPTVPKELADYNTILALFKAVRPAIHDLVRELSLVERPKLLNSVLNSMNELVKDNFFIASVPDLFNVRSFIYNPIDNLPAEKLLELTRKIQSITAVVLKKSISKVLTEVLAFHRTENSDNDNIRRRFTEAGLIGWFRETSAIRSTITSVEFILSSILFRALFAEPSNEEILNTIRRLCSSEAGSLPPLPRYVAAGTAISKVTSNITKTRTDGATSSAALARFLKENVLHAA